MRSFTLTLGSVVLALLLYCGTFTFWWLQSPTRTVYVGGKPAKLVEFQWNFVSYNTSAIWQPAFWFVQRGLGYRPAGLIALFEDSRSLYVK
jgi:hypothetical protein